MERDRAAPTGTSVKVLITQRSRVQIPPPPPRLTSTFGASPPSQKDSRTGLLSVICQWRPELRSGPFAWARTIQDQAGYGVGGLGVHAGTGGAVGGVVDGAR